MHAHQLQAALLIATYALITIAKKKLQIEASMYTLLQVFSISVFENTELRRAFAEPLAQSDNESISKPLFQIEI